VKIMEVLKDKALSLISKKVGATIGAEVLVAEAAPHLQGWPLIIFVVVQGALDGWRLYVERRWPATP
jgi:hypothetical protein